MIPFCASLCGDGPFKGKCYFFNGNNYLRYDWGIDRADFDYPKVVKNHWHGWPSSFNGGVDAALCGDGPFEGKAYFFKGNKYLRYDWGNDKVDSGYPKEIKSNWPGWPSSFDGGVDAALCGDSPFKGKAYFFKGDQYIRYDWKKDKVDRNYPQNIAECWYGVPNQDGIYLKQKHVEEILKSKLAGKLKRGCKIYLADGKYFCPTVDDVQTILSASLVDRRIWIAERHDCDDFAFLLKADFIRDAYRQGQRRSAHCVGMVWGNLPSPHAINWVINSDMKLRFIEPQTDQVFFPRSNDKDITILIS